MKKKTQWKHTLILKKLFCCFSLDARFKIVESGLADFHLFAIIAFHSITFVPCSICAHFRLHTKEEQWKTISQDSLGHSQSDSPADFWLGEDEEGWKDRKGESQQIIEEGNPDIYPLVKDSLLTDMSILKYHFQLSVSLPALTKEQVDDLVFPFPWKPTIYFTDHDLLPQIMSSDQPPDEYQTIRK